MNNLIWILKDNRAIILAYQIGFRNGLQSGESVTAREMLEVHQRHPEWVQLIGETKHDIDMIAGNLREEGLRVLNLREKKLDTNQ